MMLKLTNFSGIQSKRFFLQVISYNEYTGPYGVSDEVGNWELFNQAGKTCKWQHKDHKGTPIDR